jgi:iron complex outermembrane recepter protein
MRTRFLNIARVSAPAALVRLMIVLVAVFTLATVPGLHAQPAATGSIEGRVQNIASGRYLNNVRVTIKGTNRIAFTDDEGAYRFSDVQGGEAALEFFYTGLDVQAVTVTVVPGEVSRRDVRLTSRDRYGETSDTVMLDAYVVNETRETDARSIAINEQRFAANITNVVSTEAYGDVAEGNVGEFLKYLPGVGVDYGASDITGFSVRGMSGDLVRMTVDGGNIANANGGDRGFSFDQLSINNFSRIEVHKGAIPSMPANSIGGTVNLIPRSSFEYSRPRLNYRALLNMNSNHFTLKETGGPNHDLAHKARPGFDFSYVHPVSRTFGFSINGLHSSQFVTQQRSILTWNFSGNGPTTAQPITAANPMFRQFQMFDAPKISDRQSVGGKVDWKPLPILELSLAADHTAFDSMDTQNKIFMNTGDRPVSYGADFTNGRNGGGLVQLLPSSKRRYGQTETIRTTARFTPRNWKVEFVGAYSEAYRKDRDISEGFFETVDARIVERATNGNALSPTVRLSQFSAAPPAGIEVRNNAGTAVVDWRNLANYRMQQFVAQPNTFKEKTHSARMDVRRDFDLMRFPFSLQLGGSTTSQERDRVQERQRYNFVGADGLANSVDDAASQIPETHYVPSPETNFGLPSFQWISMTKAAQLYKDHPNWFIFDARDSHQRRAENSEFIRERIHALYLQAETRLFQNRLLLLSGVRWERTEDHGIGLLQDDDAIFQRDAQGNFVRVNGQRVQITTDPLAQARLIYTERGQSSRKDYDGYYPSAHATWLFTPNLQLRASYYKTLGRPNFGNIIPRTVANPNDNDPTIGQVTVRNPSLRPYTAKNYDIRLEYYFQKIGTVSFGVFRKDLKDFFEDDRRILDDELLAEYGLDQDYRGYELVTRKNGEGARVSGMELQYDQQLDPILPGWGKGLSVFANGSVLDRDGKKETDLRNFQPKNASWGVGYNRYRIRAMVKWIYYGRKQINTSGNHQMERTTIDANLEYQIHRRVNLFTAVRNLTNEYHVNNVLNPAAPEYSRPENQSDYGAQWTFGVRGTF